MKTQLLFLTVLVGLCGGIYAQPITDAASLSDSEIQDILRYRIDAQQQALGIVVGVVSPQGRRVISYGTFDTQKHVSDSDVVFPVGAITEVFTALLLADMDQKHEVALKDPVAKYLPKTVRIPERGRAITLQDLATHATGLPKGPTNLRPKDPSNPYADYTMNDLYQFVSAYHLTRDVGSEWEYSSIGPALLGQALALREHLTYEQLVRTRIAVPLGMKSTAITLSPEMMSRLAVGHDAQMTAVPDWTFQALAGAGAVHTTAADLLTLLAAVLGYNKSPLSPAMSAMVKVRQPTTWSELENALGWQVSILDGREIFRKDGTTVGYGNVGHATFIAYNAQSRVGVVVLSNSATLMGIEDIGLHLLDSRYPLRGRTQKEVSVNPQISTRYVGSYQLSPNSVITITDEKGHLYAQLTNQPKFPIFPQSEYVYFYKIFDAQLTFETDREGGCVAAILHYNGRHERAPRIEKKPAPVGGEQSPGRSLSRTSLTAP
jgi:serine-type D-Ala-D-Ala carboxypeptidase/endopeptidase